MSTDLSLYAIAAQYRDMAARLGDLDLDEQTVINTLEGESGALVEKSENVAFVVRNMEASAAAIKDAEAKMEARRKAIENRAARLKAYLLDAMKFAGVQKIESPYFNLVIRKNPARVDIFDTDQIPADYMSDPPPPPKVPNRTLIAAAIRDGFEVPGCKLVQGERLEIR